MKDITEIKLNEYGDETHESWVLLSASRINGSARLFDSEITHQRFVRVTVQTCSRRRKLDRDWIHQDKTILEVDMSEAQWGAFVSSFGDGSGVPATLNYFNDLGLEDVKGHVPAAPFESRLDESHKEVREAGTRSLQKVQDAYEALQEAFDGNLGKKEMRERLRTLQICLDNAPKNMEFAAKSLTKHVENVVTKARADIEGMILMQNSPVLEGPDGMMRVIEVEEQS